MLPENNETQTTPEADDIDAICTDIVESLCCLVEAAMDDRLEYVIGYREILERMANALHLMVARMNILDERAHIEVVK
jgi:hypothetical protein